MESYEPDEWMPVARQEVEIDLYQAIAKATFKKDKRVNIRISRKDLEAIQKRRNTKWFSFRRKDVL